MSNPMTCDELALTLAEYLDDDLDAATHERLERHAQSCAECGALIGDLRRLRADAQALPAIAPSRDLWAGIAERIETPVVELNNTHGPAAIRSVWRRRTTWMGLAAAAALIVVTATVTRQLTTRSMAEQVAARTAAPVRAGTETGTGMTSVANRLPEQKYDDEIARLRAVLDARRPLLDSATVVVVEHNLAVIDEAIAQCTQALRRDPASQYLIESLHDELDTKVQLLRTAAALPSRS